MRKNKATIIKKSCFLSFQWSFLMAMFYGNNFNRFLGVCSSFVGTSNFPLQLKMRPMNVLWGSRSMK